VRDPGPLSVLVDVVVAPRRQPLIQFADVHKFIQVADGWRSLEDQQARSGRAFAYWAINKPDQDPEL